MRPDLAAKYDQRVPRYTSYPTAPHFHNGIGAKDYARWLGDLPPEMPLSLYLHIAYCAEMCWFCGCHTKITQRYEPVADYLSALITEVDLVAARLPARMAADHVHFGGGSPTILSATDFARLIDKLRETFLLTPDAEIAVELDPRTADRDYVRAMAKAGVTRASLGVQDFNPQVQQVINRIQPYQMTADVFAWLREEGISQINMDLIYGLPHQSVDSLRDTIDQAIGLRPRRISLFGYAHVPWMKKHQRLIPEASLPALPERLAQYDMASARLVEHGYVGIGLDHFAAPDDDLALALVEKRLHRNFQGYTTDAAPALIGFGASAIGALPGGYIVNNGDIRPYKAAIRAGDLATARGIAVSADDLLRREIIERLMCDLAVDIDDIAARHGQTADFRAELASLAPMQGDGLLSISGHRITMTEAGRPLVRAAAAAFDRYLRAGEQRHSKAV